MILETIIGIGVIGSIVAGRIRRRQELMQKEVEVKKREKMLQAENERLREAADLERASRVANEQALCREQAEKLQITVEASRERRARLATEKALQREQEARRQQEEAYENEKTRKTRTKRDARQILQRALDRNSQEFALLHELGYLGGSSRRNLEADLSNEKTRLHREMRDRLGYFQ